MIVDPDSSNPHDCGNTCRNQLGSHRINSTDNLLKLRIIQILRLRKNRGNFRIQCNPCRTGNGRDLLNIGSGNDQRNLAILFCQQPEPGDLLLSIRARGGKRRQSILRNQALGQMQTIKYHPFRGENLLYVCDRSNQ